MKTTFPNLFEKLFSDNNPIIQAIQTQSNSDGINPLSIKADSYLDIINQVDSTLTKVVFTIGIVGILLPLIVQYFHNKNIKLERLKQEKKFNKQIIEYRNSTFSTIKTLEQEYQKMIIALQEEQKLQSYLSEANTFHIQGITYFYKGEHKLAVINYMKALFYFNICDNTNRMLSTFDNLIPCIRLITPEQLNQANNALKTSIEHGSLDLILSQIKDNVNDDSKIHDKLAEIEKTLNPKYLVG